MTLTADPLRRRLPGAAVVTAAAAGFGPAAARPGPSRAVAPRGVPASTGRYAHRLIRGGVGHNLPQEAPRAFADAVLDIARA